VLSQRLSVQRKFLIAHPFESFSACPAKPLALQAAEMEGCFASADQGGDRVIQILSAFNYRFLGPNSR
jgi:hypothetical protein